MQSEQSLGHGSERGQPDLTLHLVWSQTSCPSPQTTSKFFVGELKALQVTILRNSIYAALRGDQSAMGTQSYTI